MCVCVACQYSVPEATATISQERFEVVTSFPFPNRILKYPMLFKLKAPLSFPLCCQLERHILLGSAQRIMGTL